jgi:hypothetical protein
MGTGTLPTAWSQGVIVNLFKAGDTQLPGNYRGSLVSICHKMLRKRMDPKCTCTRLRRRSEAKILHDNLFVLTRILKAGKANKTVYAFFLDVRKA